MIKCRPILAERSGLSGRFALVWLRQLPRSLDNLKEEPAVLKGLRRAILASLLSILLAAPAQVLAWGNTGHEAVAWLAWHQMNPATKTRVLALLALVPTLHSPTTGKPIAGYAEWKKQIPSGLTADDQNCYLFMLAATWADSIKHQGFQDSDKPPVGVTKDVNTGFIDKVTHGYWHFVDAGFSSDGGSSPTTPIPNAATEIPALRLAISSTEDDVLKSYDMIWLEHLVGDIHQPLHGTVRYFQNKGDAGANLVEIELTPDMQKLFICPPSKYTPTELHAFWDDLPGSCAPAPALTPAVTFASKLPLLAPDPLKPASGLVADTNASDWATESLALAKSDSYKTPIGPGLAQSNGSAYQITPDYYNSALQDAKDRISLAGARLARLLDDNLK